MVIPEIRKRLKLMAAKLAAIGASYEDMELMGMSKDLIHYVRELYRRPAIKRAPAKAQKLTPPLKAEIKTYGEEHPNEPNRDIGKLFGVDGGRVTDSMRGKRT